MEHGFYIPNSVIDRMSPLALGWFTKWMHENGYRPSITRDGWERC